MYEENADATAAAHFRTPHFAPAFTLQLATFSFALLGACAAFLPAHKISKYAAHQPKRASITNQCHAKNSTRTVPK